MRFVFSLLNSYAPFLSHNVGCLCMWSHGCGRCLWRQMRKMYMIFSQKLERLVIWCYFIMYYGLWTPTFSIFVLGFELAYVGSSCFMHSLIWYCIFSLGIIFSLLILCCLNFLITHCSISHRSTISMQKMLFKNECIIEIYWLLLH